MCARLTNAPMDLSDCQQDRKSTRLNSSHANISYAVFCLKKQHEVFTRHRDCGPLPLGQVSYVRVGMLTPPPLKRDDVTRSHRPACALHARHYFDGPLAPA